MTVEVQSSMNALKERLSTIHDLSVANGVLVWDQQTYMPKGGTPARAETMATLSSLAHKLGTNDEMRRLLDDVSDRFEAETADAAILRIARHDFERATKLPTELVAEFARTTALAEPAWVEARAKSDWSLFAPHLARIVALQQQVAEHHGYSTHPYDALLEDFEPGMTKAELEAMFAELKSELVPLVRAILETGDDSAKRSAPMIGEFDEARQEAFGRMVATRFGYDWERGRQDRAVHPFCIGFSTGDVRITTRFDRHRLEPALFGTLHEAGHAMYEQGVSQAYARTPLGRGCSMGVHESQSRLWENIVGRSRPFWKFFYPELQKMFSDQFESVDLETFYQAINTVEPSAIRVEADEVTYNLHILLRFELEVALLDGTLTIDDLPAAWNEKMKGYLNVTPQTDAQGVLQDIHWSGGSFAYFPTYTVGNVLAVQLFEAATKTHPEIIEEMERGEFTTLHTWLGENVYQHGRKYFPGELIRNATGETLNTAPYLRYLKTKFGELYNLQ